MKLKVILTGATGMVGEGVLHECLLHPDVENVLIINRKTTGIKNHKLKEILHQDFFDLTSIREQLIGYNTCLFCLGVSSVGMKEAEFYQKTYVLTMHVATTLSELNPQMTFCYISGAGTDSTESGKSMWARVKGKTENELMKLPFKSVYAFRPGILGATPGLKNTLTFYKLFGWLYYPLRFFAPGFVSSLRELGLAMIRVSLHGYEKKVVEVKDIVALAKTK